MAGIERDRRIERAGVIREGVVVGAAKIIVGDRCDDCINALGKRLAVEPLFEDRLDALVAQRADDQRTRGGRLQTLRAVGFAQMQDAGKQARALLRMRPLGDDPPGKSAVALPIRSAASIPRSAVASM